LKFQEAVSLIRKLNLQANFDPAEKRHLKREPLISNNTASLSGTLALFRRAVLERKNGPPDFQ
jgi:hypothetical protein